MVGEGAGGALAAFLCTCVPEVPNLARAGVNARLVREPVVREWQARHAAVVAGFGLVRAGVASVAELVERAVRRAGGTHQTAHAVRHALVAALARAVRAEGGARQRGREIGTGLAQRGPVAAGVLEGIGGAGQA